jgi:hypothetical protein
MLLPEMLLSNYERKLKKLLPEGSLHLQDYYQHQCFGLQLTAVG